MLERLGEAEDSAHTLAPNAGARGRGRAVRFVSRGIETWLAAHPHAQAMHEREVAAHGTRLREDAGETDFDLLIIGSGYGASMVARTMAGRQVRDGIDGSLRPARIALLERGRERLPGMFPQRFSDLAGEVRGSFPTAPDDPLQQVPKPAGMPHGLFDFKLSQAMCALVANGLGGGSLINAGVMLAPDEAVFANGRWPRALAEAATLRPFFARAGAILGAVRESDGRPNSVAAARVRPPKHDMLERLGGDAVAAEAVPITVQLEPDTREGLRLHTCHGCGDCATGCNFDAKRSLDVMVLAQAAARGVQIYTDVTALRFEPRNHGGWLVHATHTDGALRRRAVAPFIISTRRLVVAAGSYGSTELLARSGKHAGEGRLHLSSRLGECFSGNGDMIVAVTDLPHPARAAADPALAPSARAVGPTITGALDLRDVHERGIDPMQGLDLTDAPPRVSIQELGIPSGLRDLLAQTLGLVRLTAAAVDARASCARSSDEDTRVGDALLEHSLVLAVMGDDGGLGRLELPRDDRGGIDVADGAMLMSWSKRPPSEHYQRALDWLRERCARDLPGAQVHANPIWRPLGPARMMFDDMQEGPRITVHPLGGCPMGDDADSGVVDDLGRVFNPLGTSTAEGPAVHDGLAVLDGAVVPGAIGINPALTISAVSLRAAERLAQDWGFVEAPAAAAPMPTGHRPVFARLAPDRAPPAKRPTRLTLSERLVGEAVLTVAGVREHVVLELTLHSAPLDARTTVESGARILLQGRGGDPPAAAAGAAQASIPATVPQSSRLRIFKREIWRRLHDARELKAWREQDPTGWLDAMHRMQCDPDAFLNEHAVLIAPVSGHIDVLHEQPAAAWRRFLRGGWAWLCNTGARTMWQWFTRKARDWWAGDTWWPRATPETGEAGPGIGFGRFLRERAPIAVRVMRHAGRQRDMIYSLAIHGAADLAADEPWRSLIRRGARIEGRKRVRYRRHDNPWRQLMQVHLEQFPGLAYALPLRLDLAWLAQQRTPLLRIVDEETGPDGWADYAHFLGQVSRPVLLQNLFTFTAPDTPEPVPPRRANNRHRLAQPYPDLLCECRHDEAADSAVGLAVRGENDGTRRYRLMRYRDPRAMSRWPAAAALPPVLLIHGYSASGTTWAHPSLSPGLVRSLTGEGREVWVIDMRSSSGMPTASHPWRFEDIAFGDLPAAITEIAAESASGQVDIVAHCMGAVMFSMTLLADPEHYESGPHAGLHRKVRRVVLSQAGPVMRFSAINVFRAYLMQAFRYLLPNNSFQFAPVNPEPWARRCSIGC
ncbi:MAG: alpha/beta fold hydrolase [Burkholderiaceae bacterium]